MSGQTNRLLQQLPIVYRQALLSSMEEIEVSETTVILESGRVPEFAHFVMSGVVTVVNGFASGDGVEVLSVGREGLVEATHLLGKGRSRVRAIVQTHSHLARIRFSELQTQFVEYQPLRSIILSYVQMRSAILEQISACNRHHEVEPRLARWLLTMHDRVDGDAFSITQEALAELLGTRRTTVTHAAKRLQQAKGIEYMRGRMLIADRKALERGACECYRILRSLTTDER